MVSFAYSKLLHNLFVHLHKESCNIVSNSHVRWQRKSHFEVTKEMMNRRGLASSRPRKIIIEEPCSEELIKPILSSFMSRI